LVVLLYLSNRVHRRIVEADLIAAGAIEIVGKVAELRCSNHGRTVYSFSLNGLPYSVEHGTCRSECGDQRVGEAVPLLVLPKEPLVIACAESQPSSSQHSFSFVWLGIMWVTSLVGYGELWWRHIRERKVRECARHESAS
jgi:hypothetical protein